MSLIPIDAEYHYVQDTAPTTANAGDVWLDTSQNPPVAKIYADVGNGIEWLKDQTARRVDIPVSSAGATQTDIESGVDSSQTGSTVATNLDSKVSEAGGLPYDVTNYANVATASSEGPNDGDGNSITISGAGYTLAVGTSKGGDQPNPDLLDIIVDGNAKTVREFAVGVNGANTIPVIFRFESSVKVSPSWARSVYLMVVLD